MPEQKFLIAPLKSGLQGNTDPWLIMDDAWFQLNNMHVWRGALEKKLGTRLMNTSQSALQQQLFSRLRINIGTTNGGGNTAAPITVPGSVYKAGQLFSCGTEIYTVAADGGPATMLSTSGAVPVYHTTGGSAGQFSLTGGPVTTDIYFYPAEPVTLLPNYLQANINDEQLFAFDTQFAYKFIKSTGWQRLDGEASAGDALWTTTANKDTFFWAYNYRGIQSYNFILWATNNVEADGMRYYNGDPAVNQWATFTPVYNSSGFIVKTCKIIVPFKNRLLLLNTLEQDGTGPVTYKNFYNRIRFSQAGNPLQATAAPPPYTDDAFLDDIEGKGGFIEAEVKEAITGVSFIKDRLIVCFEKSTFECVYTNNKRRPFVLQRIDNELGIESTNSIVEFDKFSLGFGLNGIHACNGMNVNRIDNAIPDEIFQVNNDEAGPKRVFGSRNYWTQEVYWSYPSTERTTALSNRYPNQVLVYNYETKTWSKYSDSITAFGYYFNDDSLTWADLEDTWEESDYRWFEPSLQSKFRSTVAGNQEGWTYIIDNEKNSDSSSLTIHKIAASGNFIALSILDHNLRADEFIKILNVQGDAGDTLNGNIYQIVGVTDKDTVTINAPGASIDYDGGGTVTVEHKPFIQSKRYNFYSSAGKKMRVTRIDYLVSKTQNGELSYNVYSAFNSINLVDDDSIPVGALYGINEIETSPLSTYEKTQDKIWRSTFPPVEGDTMQFELTLSDTQMTDVNIVESDLKIHAILIYAEETGDLGG